MAARLKKSNEKSVYNKSLDNLSISDVLCSICQSVLVEPVTLPCAHSFCLHCFNGSVENNALCCPLCRLRIGSWLRSGRKRNSLVNTKLWETIKSKFSDEINKTRNGEDIYCEKDIVAPKRLSNPGEIRKEYEAELSRLRAERLQLEAKHSSDTENLIRKIQQEEEEAHKEFLEKLKQDELLAKTLQDTGMQNGTVQGSADSTKKSTKNTKGKNKMKLKKIDEYLVKKPVENADECALLTDDNTSSASNSTTPGNVTVTSQEKSSKTSPELVSGYSIFLKNLLNKKIRTVADFWQKPELSRSIPVKNACDHPSLLYHSSLMKKPQSNVQSVKVSLPYSKFRVRTIQKQAKGLTETDSEDSMRLELCYFKPIQATVPSPRSENSCGPPVKVPGVRALPPEKEGRASPGRPDYLKSLCQLRRNSLSHKLPSAFACLLNIVSPSKGRLSQQSLSPKKVNKSNEQNTVIPNSQHQKKVLPRRRKIAHEDLDGIVKLDSQSLLRRTRSMSSIPKPDIYNTPKKGKIKDPFNKEKQKSRSETKNISYSEKITQNYTANYKNLNLVTKKLSSPTKSCVSNGMSKFAKPDSRCEDEPNNNLVPRRSKRNISQRHPVQDFETSFFKVNPTMLEEQIRIEKMIEQEKRDKELALKMQSEWNGSVKRGIGSGYTLRGSTKRQLTLFNAVTPAKKLKV